MLWTNVVNVATGVATLYFTSREDTDPVVPQFGIPYLSISVSLNILLTLMITIRLALHGRNLRATTSSPAGISGLCKTASTMLIESCALFAVSSLVVVVALARARNNHGPEIYYFGSDALDISFPILAEVQVCAFLLPQSSGQLTNVTVDWTGNRSATHHSPGRQWECIDSWQCQGTKGADG